MLNQAHLERLRSQYGIDPDHPTIREMINAGLLRSVMREEAAALLGLDPADPGLEIGGIYLEYPGTGGAAYTVRLDVPYRGKDGREQKYRRPPGQENRLFVPPGVKLDETPELWLTEGEFKALSTSLRGQPTAALSGVWNWRGDVSETDPLAAALVMEGEKAPDRIALLPDFREEWVRGKAFVLWYDSDIRPGHQAYPAFQRLAEQLYRLGAAAVKILNVPAIDDSKKTGLDDYLLAREKAGRDGLAELKALAAEAEEYLPVADGARPFAEAVAADRNAPMEKCKRAVAAVLMAEGEAAAEEMAEKVDHRRARALVKDARRLVKAKREEEKKAAEERARRELERTLAEARRDADLEKLREAVLEIRCQEKKKAAQIQEEVTGLVTAVLSRLGKFYVDDLDQTYWFSWNEKILYRMDGAEWNRLITVATGVTDAETLGSALRKALDAHAARCGEKATIRRISYFDREAVTLYLHQFDGRILRLTGGRIEQVDNGADGVLFIAKREWVPWDYVDLTADPAALREAARLFNRFVLGCNFDPTSPLSPADARLILLAWRLSGFFREIMPTRPILLLLGETESGKSTAARLWRRLLYGGKADLGKQHESEDNAMALLTNDPWAVIDNVDEHVEWLPDLLAVVGTGGVLPKRKLYTTNELQEYAFDTWLTLTARTPRFKRDDVATRLLPLRLAPLAKKEPEGRFLGEVADPETRSLALSYLVLLLDQVVAAFRRNGLPDSDEDFRMADYAAFLRAFLRATLGGREEADKKADAVVAALQELQAEFLAEGDPLLEILAEALEAGAVPAEKPLRAQELYAALAGYCKAKDYAMPVHHPARLARKLIELGPAAARSKGISILTEIDSHAKVNTFTFKR